MDVLPTLGLGGLLFTASPGSLTPGFIPEFDSLVLALGKATDNPLSSLFFSTRTLVHTP
jgi:hypothetical protein